MSKPFDVKTMIWTAVTGNRHDMLPHLSDKVRPEHCALLLVDVQNDFAADGGAMHREGRDVSMAQAMVPRLERLLEAARAAKSHIVWVRNVYNTDPNWYLSEVWLEQAKPGATAHMSIIPSASRSSGTATSIRSGRNLKRSSSPSTATELSRAQTWTWCCARAASAPSS